MNNKRNGSHINADGMQRTSDEGELKKTSNIGDRQMHRNEKKKSKCTRRDRVLNMQGP